MRIETAVNLPPDHVKSMRVAGLLNSSEQPKDPPADGPKSESRPQSKQGHYDAMNAAGNSRAAQLDQLAQLYSTMKKNGFPKSGDVSQHEEKDSGLEAGEVGATRFDEVAAAAANDAIKHGSAYQELNLLTNLPSISWGVFDKKTATFIRKNY